ncbi:MAG TPA: hypothetical protein VEP49_06475, partial [Acidimicrobiia bacterium]|nr:hypothetical protein [Acidimicrobiia bacterium]
TTIACPSSDVSTSLPAPTVTLNWTTQNASSVDVLVDGGLYSPNLGPSGSTTINIPCDGSTHTYGVTAHGTHGGTATKTLSVTTHT